MIPMQDSGLLFELLDELATEWGLRLIVGKAPACAVPVGSAPGNAVLYEVEYGPLLVVVPSVESAEDVEEVLHELAHAVHGIEAEWACFEQEALWALRFGPEVSAIVARSAFDAGGYREHESLHRRPVFQSGENR